MTYEYSEVTGRQKKLELSMVVDPGPSFHRTIVLRMPQVFGALRLHQLAIVVLSISDWCGKRHTHPCSVSRLPNTLGQPVAVGRLVQNRGEKYPQIRLIRTLKWRGIATLGLDGRQRSPLPSHTCGTARETGAAKWPVLRIVRRLTPCELTGCR